MESKVASQSFFVETATTIGVQQRETLLMCMNCKTAIRHLHLMQYNTKVVKSKGICDVFVQSNIYVLL